MRSIASLRASLGWTLRSGGARGADSAFESGAGSRVEIFTERDATPEAIRIAAEFHPKWSACNDRVRRLHGRNVMIILGPNLCSPVLEVICWTPDGAASGGTGMGIRIAEFYSISVVNLASRQLTLPTILRPAGGRQRGPEG